jgi:HKD family nuclease
MDKLAQIFNLSLQTGFVDKNILSSIQYQPDLLINEENSAEMRIVEEFVSIISN